MKNIATTCGICGDPVDHSCGAYKRDGTVQCWGCTFIEGEDDFRDGWRLGRHAAFTTLAEGTPAAYQALLRAMENRAKNEAIVRQIRAS